MSASTVAQIIVWIIVGGLAGSVAGMLTRRGRDGLDRLLNLVLGMAGAVVGGWLFQLFDINLGVLSEIAVTFDQVIAAVLGSLLILLIVYFIQRGRASRI